jgi:diguanylate cyclase (GGDEF)-like protein
MPVAQNIESFSAENPVRLLFIEDGQLDVESCVAELKRAGLAVIVDVVEGREEFIEQVRANIYHLILADYRLPTWKGIEAIYVLKQLGITIPVIVVTGNLGEESSGECIRLGAADLILKDHLPRLPVAVSRALREESLRREALHVKEELAKANDALAAQVSELNRLSGEASLIREIGDLLQTCITTAEACQVISQAMEKLFPGESGALCMLNASRNLLEAMAVWGDFQPGEGVFAPEDCWALRRGQVQAWEGAQAGLLCKHLGSSPARGSLCAPVVAHGETVGVLHLRRAPGGLAAETTQPVALARQSRAANFSACVALALANLKLRESLRWQSIRDSLSSLFNRRYMEESFDREIRRTVRNQRPLSVLLIDIDHFKNFNDSFGHDAGDTLLAALGVFLRSHTRVEDIACRYGGEEFAIILPDAPHEFAHKRAEQLCEEVKNLHIQYRGLDLEKITLSIGVSSYAKDGESPSNLIRIADAALYRAKSEGRNRAVSCQLTKTDVQSQMVSGA